MVGNTIIIILSVAILFQVVVQGIKQKERHTELMDKLNSLLK